jgi:hypothetical protein
MHRFLSCLGFALFFALAPAPAHAWNAAGHRLTASIAWQQLSPASRNFIGVALSRHPDYTRWVESARSTAAADIFAEAATWPDDIRRDPRFYNDGQEPPTPALSGFSDTARHKNWHYIDLDKQGSVTDGQLDRQIERLSQILRSTRKNEQISYALPWLLHLLADIHQPLHVGRDGDNGGNRIEIENPFNKRQPFTNLHSYWDDLPGPPWLRGRRLEKNVANLLADYPAPVQGNVDLWREESHQLLAVAYPREDGSLLPIITEEFNQKARLVANQRLVEAGYRLGRLLESIVSQRVSRETP